MHPRLLFVVLLLLGFALAGCVEGENESNGDPNETGDDPDPQLPGQSIAWGDPETATIRPGAPLGDFCTYNFLYTDAEGNAYIGTAAHCVEHGKRVILGPGGPEIGTVVYDSDTAQGADTRVDFALIRLDPDQIENAHPHMIDWEGPTGMIEAGEASVGDQVAIHGYGMVLGERDETRARFGVLMSEDGKYYTANMPAVYGDSGSPLLHVPTGKAFGIISQFGFESIPPSTDVGPIMPHIINELERGGFNVTLATI